MHIEADITSKGIQGRHLTRLLHQLDHEVDSHSVCIIIVDAIIGITTRCDLHLSLSLARILCITNLPVVQQVDRLVAGERLN